MVARPDHTEEEVGPVVLNSTTENLLISRDSGSPLDGAKCMDSSSDAQVSNSLRRGIRIFLSTSTPFLAIFNWDLGETNTDGTNIATEDIPTIKGLPSSDSIIQTLKIDLNVS